MKLLIDIDVSPEEFKKIQIFNIKMMDSKITHKVYEAVQNGKPLFDMTPEQISDAFLNAINIYWEERSKYLTSPPEPAQCNNCPNEKRGTFVSGPTEVVKIGEPLSNSDEIKAALEKGELYRRGFKDAMKRYKRPTGKWVNTNEYVKHLEETTGKKYEVAFNMLFCNNCWKTPEPDSKKRTNFCPNCGAEMMKGSVEE